MPNYLDLEPDELRRIAGQHDRAATSVRKWGEIPEDWLADFRRTRGWIAEPLRDALVDYYRRRHEKAERQAADHERTRDDLLAAAEVMEGADQDSGGRVSQAGSGFAAPAGPASPSILPAVSGPMPKEAGPQTGSAGQRSGDVLGPTRTPVQTSPVPHAGATSTSSTPPTSAAVPQFPVLPPDGVVAPERTVGPPVTSSAGGADAQVAGPAAEVATDATPAVAGAMSGLPTAPTGTGGSGNAGVEVHRRLPGLVPPGPLAAVGRNVGSKPSAPSLVVGAAADDLPLARTLLAATLAAVGGSQPGVEWAVAVLRVRGGAVVMLTSTEGRGWLPSGLFLPTEVVIPWRWDTTLGRTAPKVAAALEGVSDPGRILVEFAALARRGRLSALTSSTTIPDDLWAALNARVAVEDHISAASCEIDLTVPSSGLSDRLALAGSDDMLNLAATLPDADIRATCLELVRDAERRLRAVSDGLDEGIRTHRAQRQRILEALHSDLPVPANWVGEMRSSDAMVAAMASSRRRDRAEISVHGISGPPAADGIRDMTFERRVGELLLLLSGGPPNRQILRDVLYAYGQIIEHPQLPERAATMNPPRAYDPGTEVRPVTASGRIDRGGPDLGAINHAVAAATKRELTDPPVEILEPRSLK